MKRRFQTQAFLGWHLVAGLLVFFAMTLTLGELAEDVRNGEPLTVTDVQLSNSLHRNQSRSLTTSMFIVTSFGSTKVVTCLAVLGGLYLIWRRRPYWFAVLFAAVLGGALLNRTLKFAFQRARPHFTDPIFSLTSYSFPSGHTMMATVLYGALAAYLLSKTSGWGWRILIICAAGVMILLVGFSRIYLGAHYLSDVLAAMAEGLAWLSLCLTAVYSVWLHKKQAK